MKAIIALTMAFAFAMGHINVGSFQPAQIDDFLNSVDGEKIKDLLSQTNTTDMFNQTAIKNYLVLYVSTQIVAGKNYKLALVDDDRKLHLVKVYVPLKGEISVTRMATVDQGTDVLIGHEGIKPQVQNYLESYFSDSFDGATYTIKNFLKFEHAKSEQKSDIVILAKYVLEGTDNSIAEMETVLLQDANGNFEPFFHSQDKIGVVADDSPCGQYITVINCLLDKKCIADQVQEFGKCTPTGFLSRIA